MVSNGYPRVCNDSQTRLQTQKQTQLFCFPQITWLERWLHLDGLQTGFVLFRLSMYSYFHVYIYTHNDNNNNNNNKYIIIITIIVIINTTTNNNNSKNNKNSNDNNYDNIDNMLIGKETINCDLPELLQISPAGSPERFAPWWVKQERTMPQIVGKSPFLKAILNSWLVVLWTPLENMS